MPTLLLTVLLSACAGGLLIFLFLRKLYSQQQAALTEQLSRQAAANQTLGNERDLVRREKEEWLEKASKAESRNDFLEQQLVTYYKIREEHQAAQKQLSAYETELKNAEEKLLLQKEELNEIGEKFRFEFRNMAQTIMEEKSAKFTEVNEAKIGALLTPLKMQLGEFKTKVEETYDKESKERFSLGKEVERLITMTQQVSLEANNLTTALKGNNKMQGNWGEMILESILENCGLCKNRDYFLQEFIRDNAGNVIKDENGKGLQPDATIAFPDGRKVIVDSKVSLVAWDEYIAAADPADQKRFLQNHTKSIRAHVDGLSKKNYPRYAGALEHVLLFVPIEPAYLEALKSDNTLWKYAYDKNILLVSATNLFAVLKIVADLWKVEKENRNAVDIANKAGALYDKFAGFMENFELVGRKLTEAGTAFDNAHKQISTGKGNLANRVEELKKMGARAEKQLPARLLETQIEDDAAA